MVALVGNQKVTAGADVCPGRNLKMLSTFCPGCASRLNAQIEREENSDNAIGIRCPHHRIARMVLLRRGLVVLQRDARAMTEAGAQRKFQAFMVELALIAGAPGIEITMVF